MEEWSKVIDTLDGFMLSGSEEMHDDDRHWARVNLLKALNNPLTRQLWREEMSEAMRQLCAKWAGAPRFETWFMRIFFDLEAGYGDGDNPLAAANLPAKPSVVLYQAMADAYQERRALKTTMVTLKSELEAAISLLLKALKSSN